MALRQGFHWLGPLTLLFAVAVGASVGAQPQPLEKDDHTIFLAHFDGNTAAGGLAADFTRGDPAPKTQSGCVVSAKPEGRFGRALQLKETGYATYELKDVNLESCSVEAWFRIDSENLAWAKPGNAHYRYRILEIYGHGKPYDRIFVGFRWGGLDIVLHAQGKEAKKRFCPIGIGQWLVGSEHSVAVTVDGSKGDGQTVLRIYVDGQRFAQVDGLSPMRTKNYTLWLGKKVRPTRQKSRAMGGLIDEVRISDVARKHVDLSRPQWRGFVPGPYERCRTHLPLFLYFSEPVDKRITQPVRLIDVTAGNKPVPYHGKYIGNGSMFEMNPASPLPFGHELAIEFEKGQNQVRDATGNRLDVTAVPPQRFRTRARGEAPRLLPLKFRNDNTHVTVRGMERMCEHMDAIEFSITRIKDGWVTNHLDRKAKIIPAQGGDKKGFQSIQKRAVECTYAELAAVDFSDVSDGKIDPIPRCKDLYEVIKRWDKVVHLQVRMAKKMPAAEQKALLDAWLKEFAFDWSRFHSWHKAKRGVLPEEKNSRYALAYPYRPYRPRGRKDDPGFPGFTNPEWVRQARQHGKTVWGSIWFWHPVRPTKKWMGIAVPYAARLGADFFVNNDLAYRGDRFAREALYQLHQYEGAAKPVVRSIKIDARTAGSPKPKITVRFDQSVESRSFNYNSVRLTRKGDKSGKRFPLRIDRDAEWRTFTVTPQQPLGKGTYVVEIGDDKEPVSVAGMSLAKKGRLTVTVK